MSQKACVGIVDYKAGNIQSIENAFLHLGARVVRVVSEEDLVDCTHLVLPGVGSFGFCADNLRMSDLIGSLEFWTFDKNRPLLGICVGMQLLSDGSEESPEKLGLGWLGGDVKAILPSSRICVPHVGWNTVSFEHAYGTLLAGQEKDFYFDHSFAYHNPRYGKTIGFCHHGVSFSAIIERDNITVTQFHPEKSQQAGLEFIKNFLERT